MQQAVLIAGDEKRHAEPVNEFLEFIQDDLRVCRYSLNTIKGLDKKSMYWYLSQELQLPRLSNEPVLILYSGHGNQEGWTTKDGEVVMPYRGLAKIIAAFVHEPFILINDCCHAEAVIPAFEISGLAYEDVEIFAACETEEVSYGGMIGEILESWQKGSYFDPRDHPVYRTYVDYIPKPYEEIIGGWKDWFAHNTSMALHQLSPQRFAIKPLYRRVLFHNNASNKEDEGPITDRIRWGAKLDRYFFPFSERQRRLPNEFLEFFLKQ